MKQCPKCGLTYTDDLSFCLEDGSLLKDFDFEEETVLKLPLPLQNPIRETAVSKPRTGLFIALTGLVMVIVVGGLFFVYVLNRNNPVSQTTNKPAENSPAAELDLKNAETLSKIAREENLLVLKDIKEKDNIIEGNQRKPNPLTLVVAITDNETNLNKEPFPDLSSLTAKLSQIFKLRDEMDVLDENGKPAKTVTIVTPGTIDKDKFLKTVKAVRDAGAEPVELVIEK